MDRKDFIRALSQHSLPQVLLFEGEEEHLKQEALSEHEQAITGSRSDELPGNPHRHHLHHELPGQDDASGQRL